MLLLSVLAVFLGATAVAQTSNLSQNKIDQTKVSSAKVDPVTLALNLEIPLGSYPGRAGASIPLSISYSSKLWTTQNIPGNDFTHMPDQTLAVFANNSMQGWTSSLKVPFVVFTGQFQPFDTYAQPQRIISSGFMSICPTVRLMNFDKLTPGRPPTLLPRTGVESIWRLMVQNSAMIPRPKRSTWRTAPVT